MTLSLADTLFFLAFGGIWLTLGYWIFLGIGAAISSTRSAQDRAGEGRLPPDPPLVSILVPAHDEELVIENTVRALAAQDYPQSRFEIIVINDGSRDGTGQILSRLADEFPHLVLHEVPPGQGGRGKSRTLNIGLRRARGSLIAVFDADNTPEPDCPRLLVATLLADRELVAVNAKVRTRNADASWLTRFINLELIYFQRLFQAGRWHWFRLSMLMGTGYVIHRNILELLGNFDEDSLVDDTEMSLRIFRGQRRIRWVPYAVTWEQEPEDPQFGIDAEESGGSCRHFASLHACCPQPMPPWPLSRTKIREPWLIRFASGPWSALFTAKRRPRRRNVSSMSPGGSALSTPSCAPESPRAAPRPPWPYMSTESS